MPEPVNPTQEFVEIDSVQNGVVVLKNGSLRQILIVSGINFDLKSEDEKTLILGAYQNLINSLKFSLQFFIHSRRVNIDSYLQKISALGDSEKNELLKNQITEYVAFVKSFVGENPIMTKAFFIVVPFDPIILPEAAKGAKRGILGLFGRKGPAPEQEETEKQHILMQNIDQLSQRTSQVVAALSQVGLRAVPLENEEIIELFYNLYNPESVERKGVQI
jgi:type IV secretory pathway VirB4 component